MSQARWNIAKPITPEEKSALGNLSPLLAQLLYNRGLRTQQEAERFLDPEHARGDPFDLPDMHRAVARVRQAIRAGETIAIYGDYDADGVTATALLTQTLQSLGAKVIHHIPHRAHEGYGLNRGALAELASQGVGLVVTVDCGVRALEEVAFALRRGLDMVITDHHALAQELPPAHAVVNPKRPDSRYPHDELAGVGVAFKLAQALLRVERNVPARRGNRVALQDEDLLDLVALGTVADVVPLVGENRALVWRGLQKLNSPTRPGLQAMLREAGVRPGNVESWTIGYVLGPRINAAGRLETAQESLALLMTTDQEQATTLAQRLGARNRRRQEITKRLLEEARSEAMAQGIGSIILVAGKQYLVGIAGLVAGLLTREFYRPAIVLELGDELSKASARSIPEFHITHALDQCADLLVRHGGHAEAAGFTLRTEAWPELAQRLRQLADDEMDGKTLLPVVDIEAEIPLAISQAFRDGHMGVMDYYNIRNLQSDTEMRNAIAAPGGRGSDRADRT